jgi:hypothetical protein
MVFTWRDDSQNNVSVTLIDIKLQDMKRNPFPVRRVILIILVCYFSSSIMAQKINLDTLDIDQLNLYQHKAVSMKNTGMILTLSGVGIVVAGYITGIVVAAAPSDEPYHSWIAFPIIGITGMAGFITSAVGIPLWAIGGSRKANAEFYTLNVEQYKDKAVTTRNTGMILALSGIGLAATGIIIYVSAENEYSSALGVVSGIAGISTTMVGIPLWTAGASRKVKAELALQKFNIMPENSMAVGLGITLRF